jgi:hypothetical protein
MHSIFATSSFRWSNNVKVIVDYILTMKSEVNISDHYRRDLIEVLSRFSKYSNNKPFKDLMHHASFFNALIPVDQLLASF